MRPEHFAPSPVTPGIFHLKTTQILRFPEFLFFPMAPTRSKDCGGGARLPPLRSVARRKGAAAPAAGASSFLAHTKHRPAFDCCPAGLAGATDCVDVALPDADAAGDNVPHR